MEEAGRERDRTVAVVVEDTSAATKVSRMLLPTPGESSISPLMVWRRCLAYLEVPFPVPWPDFDSAFCNLPSNCFEGVSN
jgi:hypothetical protein